VIYFKSIRKFDYRYGTNYNLNKKDIKMPLILLRYYLFKKAKDYVHLLTYNVIQFIFVLGIAFTFYYLKELEFRYIILKIICIFV
jgi:hypothetical protein